MSSSVPHSPSPMPDGGAAPAYFAGLNPVQSQAVETTEGPLLVLAGAGTGKTRVLTTRLAHILISGRARPGEVLAVTFTNKAAQEMKERVQAILRRPVESLWLGTFHALGARILRRHAELVGLKPDFTILDTDDQLRLLKQILSAANIDEKRWPARSLLAVISRWKDRGLSPGKVTAAEDSEFAGGRALEFYQAYQQRLRTLNACDFGDLLLHCLELFTSHGDVLEEYQQRFHYLLVDEYQDTNVAQYLWLRLLARKRANICCVGDDDQSIYGWRGAEVGNILRFEKDFPGAQIVRLEQNYRSTTHILGAASGMIAHNNGRLGKTLWTEIEGGDKIAIRGVWDGEDEARQIGEEIEAAHARGEALSSMAILVRAGFQTREFEERFITLGLPYRVVGGPRFYERQEIRDAIAYLRIITQPQDDLAFERIVNVPRRGIGDATFQTLHQLARQEGIPLLHAAGRLVESDELRPQSRRALAGLIEQIGRWRGQLDAMPHPELAGLVLDESGYTEMWQRDKSPTAPGRLENLKELINALEEFENLGGFLEHVSLVMENMENPRDDMVSIMTLHSAKGLEFDTVFLPGWEETLFPNQRSLDEGGIDSLEEERRLAYVGITRARRRVQISYAGHRRVFDQWQNNLPSRFIGELPEAHIEHETLFAGPATGHGNLAGLGEDADGFDYGGATPGARRRQRYGRGLGETRRLVPPSRSNQPRRPVPAGGEETGLRVGAEVFHQKFGYGRILSVEGDKLAIAFEKAGTKRVISSFVELVPSG